MTIAQARYQLLGRIQAAYQEIHESGFKVAENDKATARQCLKEAAKEIAAAIEELDHAYL
jgi:hypothetical protein